MVPGEYGDFGELMSNHQIDVNQFHRWWPAILAKLVNMAILAYMAKIAGFTRGPSCLLICIGLQVVVGEILSAGFLNVQRSSNCIKFLQIPF